MRVPPPLREMHHEFARAALDHGWLRLWLLELDGRPLAAWYGLRFADAEWFYQSGRDPAADTEHVGFVLLAHTIRAAIQDGVGDYPLLRGDEEYKSRFADRDPGLQTIALPLTARGRSPWRRAAPARSVGRALRRLAPALSGRFASVATIRPIERDDLPTVAALVRANLEGWTRDADGLARVLFDHPWAPSPPPGRWSRSTTRAS